jgi:hypothetical protein
MALATKKEVRKKKMKKKKKKKKKMKKKEAMMKEVRMKRQFSFSFEDNDRLPGFAGTATAGPDEEIPFQTVRVVVEAKHRQDTHHRSNGPTRSGVRTHHTRPS